MSSENIDFKVADLSLAEAGRHRIHLVKHEMPGLMALHEEYAEQQPLAGARISSSIHMTVRTAVLIETLTALGTQVRWASCNIFSTQDEAAAAIVVGRSGTPEDPQGVPVFAWRGETLEEYWWCLDRIFDWGDEDANMILDDGGGAIMAVIKGMELEDADLVPPAEESDSDEFIAFKDMLRVSLKKDASHWHRIAKSVKGVTEGTTTGVHRLYHFAEQDVLPFPVMDVNDAVTKLKLDNKYGTCHSLLGGIDRDTDMLVGGKNVLVCGYDDVGKGCTETLAGQDACVQVTEADPINALQASMDSFDVVATESVIADVDIVTTATGNKGVITFEHMQQMKNHALLGNIGHFGNEIDTHSLHRRDDVHRVEIKPQITEYIFPYTNGEEHSLIVLSEGHLLNPGSTTGYPSFVMLTSFADQTIVQIEPYCNGDKYDDTVHRLPKILDGKVARIHVKVLGGEITRLSKEQAKYIGVDVEGPYKPKYYRYQFQPRLGRSHVREEKNLTIAVEGIDGAGKNTFAAAVSNQLRSQGHSIFSMTSPAYRQTTFADFADQALHGQLGDTTDSAWAMVLLFALDRKERRQAIADAARENDIPIIDRYVASNVAYSLARTQNPAIVEWIEKTEFGDFQLPLPDVQVCLATSVGVVADRTHKREASDVWRTRDAYEKDSGLQERTLVAYQKFAEGSRQSPWLMPTEDDGADRLVEWISARLRQPPQPETTELDSFTFRI